MKKKGLLALLLCLAMLSGIVLAGCSSNGIIVGKVGKELITTKDVDLYVSYILMQNNYSRSDITDAATMTSLNTNALDTAVTYKLIMQKGKEKGYYPLSDANQKAVDSTVSTYMTNMKSQYLASYQEKAKTDKSIDPDKLAQADVDAQLKTLGLTAEDIKTLVTQSKVASLLMADATKDVTVTDADIQAEYDKQLAAQKKSYDADASAYESAKSDGTTVIVYKPAGYRYVKHILITFPDDISSQITTAQTNGDTDTVAKLRKEGLPLIKAKADEVLAKVKAGGDFDALMKEYGKDPGMQTEPESKTGYELGSATSFVTEFKDAALKLAKIGDTTDLVESDYGYHIIKWVGDVPSGPVALADVKDALSKSLLSTKQDTKWNDTIAQWKKETTIEQHVDKIPVVLPSATAKAAG